MVAGGDEYKHNDDLKHIDDLREVCGRVRASGMCVCVRVSSWF